MERDHCKKASVSAEISEDGKLIFVRVELSSELCCTDCFKEYLHRFMAELDFKQVDKSEFTPLH